MHGVGVKYTSIDKALLFNSTKLPFPFVIGHECNIPFKNEEGKECVRKREFYAFHSVEDFLGERYLYPHAHEMVLDRGTQLQDGRIVFDFDVSEFYFRNAGIVTKNSKLGPQIDSTGTASGYVAPSFELDIEKIILVTLKNYYAEVDIKKLKFVWLGSKNPIKFSRHLIIVGTRMKDDWATQLQSFYALFRYEAYLSGLFYYFPNMDKLIDGQVPKKNASLRLCGAKKMKEGSQPLVAMIRVKDNRRLFMPEYLGITVDRNCIPKIKDNPNLECDVSFHDTMIQNFDKKSIMTEQTIPMQRLNLAKVMQLRDIVFEEAEEDEEENIILKKKENDKDRVTIQERKRLLRNIPQLRKALEDTEKGLNSNVIITEHDLELISELDDCFEYRETKGDKIFLNRVASGPCMISGYVHDSEHACLQVKEDESVIFYCFRGCTNSQGYPGLIIRKGTGEYTRKQPTKDESLFYLLNMQKEQREQEEEDEEEEDDKDKDEEEEKLKKQMKEAMNNFRKQQKKNKQKGLERRKENKTIRVETHKDMFAGIKFKQEATDVISDWMKRHK